MRDLSNARCAKHPDRQAVENCERCGAFVCAECLELTPEGNRCNNCYERVTKEKPSTRAISALVFAIVGLNCCLLPGVIGLVLGTAELAAIERGEAPAAGRNLARGGQIVGGISAVLFGLAVIGGLIFAFFMKDSWGSRF